MRNGHLLNPIEMTPFSVRYHLTGGLTGIVYGEPRMTQDIDIVVDNQQFKAHLNQWIESLSRSDFLFDERTIRQAVQESDEIDP